MAPACRQHGSYFHFTGERTEAQGEKASGKPTGQENDRRTKRVSWLQRRCSFSYHSHFFSISLFLRSPPAEIKGRVINNLQIFTP